jgi:hypothetical protein
MSLVSFAVRLIVTRAVTGRTFAGARVLNSPVEPLEDLLATDAPATPLIAVFTGLDEHEAEGRDLRGGRNKLTLTIQVLIPPKLAVGGLDFDARGPGAAAVLDFTWRQIARALAVETNPWARLFTTFVARIESITATPVLYEVDEVRESRIRIPACEYVLAYHTLAEPMWGRPLAFAWADLDAAMRTEPELIPLAGLVKDLIEKPDGMPDWRVVQAAFGWSDADIRACGLAPADATEAGEPPELAEPDGIAIDPADLHQSTPFAVLPDLASSLHNLALRLFGLGRNDEALAAAQEAVGIRRQLAQAQPDAMLPRLAASLGAMSDVLVALSRPAEAAQAANEALALLVPFVERYPDVFGETARAVRDSLRRASEAVGQEPDAALLARAARALGDSEAAASE